MNRKPKNIVDFWAARMPPKSLAVHAGPMISMLEVHQDAHREPDNPPLDDIVIVEALSRFDCLVDNGPGPFLHSAREGDFFVVPPKVTSRVDLYQDNLVRLIAAPFEQARHLLEREVGIDELAPLFECAFRDEWLAGLMDRLWLASAQDAENRLLGDECAALILFALRTQVNRLASAPKGRLAAWQVDRIVDYMMAHLDANVSLGELAALVGLSPFHLARAFKASTGEAPHTMYTRLRVARAKELLLHTDRRVADIAASVGFGQTSHFARAFGRLVGFTPSEFRRQERQ